MESKKHFVSALVIGIIFAYSSVFAQEVSDKNFLFNTDKVQLSTFFVEIAPGTNFSQLNGQMASTFVISGGFILNDRFSVSYFSASSPKINLLSVPLPGTDEYDNWLEAGVELDKLPSSQELVYVNFKHSGLKFDYMHRTDRILFWRAGLSVGFLGGLTISENKTFLGLFNNVIYDEPVISLAPEFGMGVNLLPWWRVHLDFGYRILGADTRVMSSSEADSFTLNLGFAFGKFGN